MNRTDITSYAVLVVAWLLVMVVHGTVPAFMSPTLGQAVWTTGFAQSFANEGIWAIYAQNIGAPEPAAIAFGLSGAWVTSLFLTMGLSAPDAYSAMMACWMTLAFISAYGLARHFHYTKWVAALAAVVWMLAPVTWNHAGYSMLSSGMALLSFYFLVAIKLYEQCCSSDKASAGKRAMWIILYPVACFIAVFMDGYTFMLFAIGASIIFSVLFFKSKTEQKKRLFLTVFPVHGISFIAAYALYALYIGKASFEAAPIDFFRGWGADISFFVLPTKGVHWIPDLLGISMQRSGQKYFGDSSVWVTSFSVPLIIGALWAFRKTPKRTALLTGVFAAGLFGFYMSLGPSVKVFSTKPNPEVGELMSKEYALMPTGSALLSRYLPGFNNMRASYRWIGLGMFAFWLFFIIALSPRVRYASSSRVAWALGAIALLYMPTMPEHIKSKMANRESFLEMESSLVDDMRNMLSPGDRVAFLPWTNDFLVNYVASKLDVVAYNIGGDKNYSLAREHWPEALLEFSMKEVGPDFPEKVLKLLESGAVDAVIFPYMDMLRAAHFWPYPLDIKEKIQPVEQAISSVPLSGIHLERREFYSVVKASVDAEAMIKFLDSDDLFQEYRRSTRVQTPMYPYSAEALSGEAGLKALLDRGWYNMEHTHVWSSDEASLLLPIPTDCNEQACSANLRFRVFGASKNAPKVVYLKVNNDEEFSLELNSSEDITVPISFSANDGKWKKVGIRVPEAESPKNLIGTNDARTLGIALKDVTLTRKDLEN